ncbi:MAG: DNA mismatch repair endonuclease MutL [Bacteroidota bacterium]
MSDIIKLLPDSVANQIAAGEVVQRPASAVKELMENAIDAGATEIKLIIKDAGRTLIQVIDNGCGMSTTDARLSFERHATSKISQASDLFAIRTMGFRGEALASIAAISHVELKTKLHDEELGTSIIIEGSDVKKQEPCTCSNGSSISIKNLFFNVPARRNFLKSDSTETFHIIEEFQRIALAHPDKQFLMHHNDKLVFKLDQGNLKQRIVSIFGSAFNERIIPVEQDTQVINIHGFVGKPEFVKKGKCENYFFVNNRFIRHPYLNHALNAAYVDFIPAGTNPIYFVFFQVDPKIIDINIHPTKTEIKFQDEKTIYAILRSTVKQSLGKHLLIPTIDFETEASIQFDLHPERHPIVQPVIKVNPDFNPFESATSKRFPSYEKNQQTQQQYWEKLYTDERNKETPKPELASPTPSLNETFNEKEDLKNQDVILFQQKYIITSVQSGILLIDLQRALERIYYEEFSSKSSETAKSSQQLLFPQTYSCTPSEAELMNDILPELSELGFEINSLGNNTYVVNATPPEIINSDISDFLSVVLSKYKSNMMDVSIDKTRNLALSFSKKMSQQIKTNYTQDELIYIIDRLFACGVPQHTPLGKKVISIFSIQDMENIFK